MKRRIKYTNEPISALPIPDFLPPPHELRARLKRVKVTVEVEQPTLELFQSAAKSPHDYRKLMGELLDLYATRQQAKAS